MSRELENIKRLIENKGVHFRDFQITNIETRAAEDGEAEKMIIRGIPAVFGVQTKLFEYRDWDGWDVEIFEEVHEDAFDEADMTDVIFNYNHGGRVFSRTRNRSLILEVNKKKGLEMETELWDDDEGHRQLYRDIKRKNIDRMSYAYAPKKIDMREEVDEDENRIRRYLTLREVKKVYDVSAVDIPAYDATEISARRWIEAESGIMKPDAPAESGQLPGANAESVASRMTEAFELERRILLTRLGGK